MDTAAQPDSSIAQRSVLKTSGQFNTDSAGVANVVASVDQFFAETDGNDAFATTKTADSGLQEVGLPEDMVDAIQTPLLDLKTAFDLDFENSSDFLESFTDLSNFLMDGTDMDTTESPVAKDPASPATLSNDDSLVEIDASAILDDMFNSMTAASSSSATILDEPTPVKRKRSEDDYPESSSPLADHSSYVSRPKRSRASISDDSDAAADVKYRDRRNKNNIASKRSRQTRKQKFVHMEERAIELERANEELRGRVEELEELAKEMKEALVKRLAK